MDENGAALDENEEEQHCEKVEAGGDNRTLKSRQ